MALQQIVLQCSGTLSQGSVGQLEYIYLLFHLLFKGTIKIWVWFAFTDGEKVLSSRGRTK